MGRDIGKKQPEEESATSSDIPYFNCGELLAELSNLYAMCTPQVYIIKY